jgi:hypothetical protein
MKNRILLMGIISLVLSFGCNSRPNFVQDLPAGVHEVTLKEFLQTNNYTYLLVSEKGKEQWLAVPKMEAKTGGTYYYKGGMEMPNFKSKELNRNFESVLCVEKVSTSPDQLMKSQNIPATTHAAMVKKGGKENLSIDPVEGGITIAELFANKEKYNGKTVKIKGKVIKINTKIMGKNWIHLQDGTEYGGLYDLTATSTLELNVGDIISLEGKITLNKDFGYGYKYDILMEEAVLAK